MMRLSTLLCLLLAVLLVPANSDMTITIDQFFSYDFASVGPTVKCTNVTVWRNGTTPSGPGNNTSHLVPVTTKNCTNTTSQIGTQSAYLDISVTSASSALEIMIQELPTKTSTSAEEIFHFTFKLMGIAAYVEADGKPGYTPPSSSGGDVQRGFWAFDQSSSSSQFQWTQLSDLASVNDVTIRRFQGRTIEDALSMVGYVAGLPFALATENAPIGIVTPTSFKFDLIFNCGPLCYDYNNVTQLALVVNIQTLPNSNITFVPGVGINNRSSLYVNGKGFFHWVNNILVNQNVPGLPNGGNVSVIAQSIGPVLDTQAAALGEVSQQVTFAFDTYRPSNLYWDPVVGSIPTPKKDQQPVPRSSSTGHGTSNGSQSTGTYIGPSVSTGPGPIHHSSSSTGDFTTFSGAAAMHDTTLAIYLLVALGAISTSLFID